MSGSRASGAPAAPFDEDRFIRETEPFRCELRAHCYRMLGSVEDAEDVLQDTYVRAWRSWRRFEGRSSVRVWLYRIATKACLTALQHRERRMLPSSLTAPSDRPDADAGPAAPHVWWLEPIPDTLITPESQNPSVVAATRASVRLAMIASLQHLPGAKASRADPARRAGCVRAGRLDAVGCERQRRRAKQACPPVGGVRLVAAGRERTAGGRAPTLPQMSAVASLNGRDHCRPTSITRTGVGLG